MSSSTIKGASSTITSSAIVPTLTSICSSYILNNLQIEPTEEFIQKSNDRFVVNVSKHRVTGPELSVLRKGLTFCPTPGEPDMGELRRDLDRFHRNLKLKSHFSKSQNKDERWSKQLSKTGLMGAGTVSLRGSSSSGQISLSNFGPFSHPDFTPPSNFILENIPYTIEAFVAVNELQSARTETRSPTRQNITREERQALRDLQSNKSIVIKKADKGSAIVIQDIEDYQAEGYKQLSDDMYYKKVESDLTMEHSK